MSFEGSERVRIEEVRTEQYAQSLIEVPTGVERDPAHAGVLPWCLGDILFDGIALASARR